MIYRGEGRVLRRRRRLQRRRPGAWKRRPPERCGSTSPIAASAARISTSRTVRWTIASRAPQVIGHEMSGTVAEVGDGVEGVRAGRPDRRAAARRARRDVRRQGIQPRQPRAEVPRDRFAGRLPELVDRPGLHAAPRSRLGRPAPRRAGRAARRRLPRCPPRRTRGRRERTRDRRVARSACSWRSRRALQGARVVVSEVNPARARLRGRARPRDGRPELRRLVAATSRS